MYHLKFVGIHFGFFIQILKKFISSLFNYIDILYNKFHHQLQLELRNI